jgi:hypothetical protein
LDGSRQLPTVASFASFGKRPLLDEILWTPEPDPLINGPLESIGDLNGALSTEPTFRGLFLWISTILKWHLLTVISNGRIPWFAKKVTPAVMKHALYSLIGEIAWQFVLCNGMTTGSFG